MCRARSPRRSPSGCWRTASVTTSCARCSRKRFRSPTRCAHCSASWPRCRWTRAPPPTSLRSRWCSATDPARRRAARPHTIRTQTPTWTSSRGRSSSTCSRPPSRWAWTWCAAAARSVCASGRCSRRRCTARPCAPSCTTWAWRPAASTPRWPAAGCSAPRCTHASSSSWICPGWWAWAASASCRRCSVSTSRARCRPSCAAR
mmetsp:Transcript_18372/g.46704  ORF Transcript_18372/g.46704 Transcript_18372/m.46704 type:complete len:203 (-) Transcript_18372:550-1158(-)